MTRIPDRLPRRAALKALAGIAALSRWPQAQAAATLQSWPLGTPRRTGIHDVAPAPDGGVWFTAQRSGELGWFDPKTARVELIALGRESAPHGVVQGPDRAAWITDGGQNAIVRVGWPGRDVRVLPLPAGTPWANLNTSTFDHDGDLWFTGQGGWVGKLAVKTGQVTVRQAPRGAGPYGICTTPQGDVWWCSLAGSFIAKLDRKTGDSAIVEPPTPRQGARRIWSDSRGTLWVSEWNSGQLSAYDPVKKTWRTHRLPGAAPRTYAVWVDEHDHPWVSDFGSNAVLRFDPGSDRFERHALARESAEVREIQGRPGEVWLPESGTETISLIRTG
jgi:virginiamycin B lyase